MRALLVDRLTCETDPLRVMLTRNELARLFDGAFDGALARALSSRLHISELLEDIVQILELEVLVTDGEDANPDLGAATTNVPTYWIATPGNDDDVVVPLLGGGWLVGVMFGEWRHGPTCVIDVSGTITSVRGTELECDAVPTLSAAEALDTLRSYASASSGAR
jgi:hypothetical protein